MAGVAQRRRERLKAGKEKRKKIFAIAGLVVMAILLGIQGPRMLDLLSSDAPPVPPAAAPAPAPPATTEPETPPEALRLLRAPAASDPFARRSLVSTDPAPAAVPWPPGTRDPFVPAGVATVIAPTRIVVGTPGSGRAPTVGYIVIIASIRTSAGRAVAEEIAQRATEDGLRLVGVLDSSQRRPLRAGYYVAYLGPYSRGSAARSAMNRARTLGYRTAYIRELVKY